MRILPIILIVAGALLGLYGLADYSGTALPYQDPTPELLAKQKRQLETATIFMGVGLGLLAVGLVWRCFDSRARLRAGAGEA